MTTRDHTRKAGEALARVLLDAIEHDPEVQAAMEDSAEPYRAAAYACGMEEIDGTELWGATMDAIG